MARTCREKSIAMNDLSFRFCGGSGKCHRETSGRSLFMVHLKLIMYITDAVLFILKLSFN